MSSYKNKNKKRLQIEDEIIPDLEYFSGQQNYWSVVKHNKTIRIQKVKVILKNVSTSSAYREYIETYPISKCKKCMGCLRIKPCLCCYICKNLDTQLCSKLICFTNPSNDALIDYPPGIWPHKILSNNKMVIFY